MNRLRLILIGLLCFVSISRADVPLPATQAFVFNVNFKNSQEITLHWVIAPGYYLYKNRLSFKILSPKNATLKHIQYPPGIPTEDHIFGKYEIYYNQLNLPIHIEYQGTAPVELQINYQGCSKSGFCYPPSTQIVYADLNNQQLTTQDSPKISEQDHISNLLAQKNTLFSLLIFLGFGLLLTFTPCVLPMLPILSGIILEQGRDLKPRHAFGLSLAYVLGMALTFAIAGVIAGYVGSSLQAIFQKPWVIVLFSGFFVILALSLFGFYDIQIPHAFRQQVLHWGNRQKSGSYIGVTIMGILSALIVSPCVSAPLIGALSYIGKTGNALFGGISLFVMGIGMGIPLLILGTIGGSLLPKTGVWMNTIKSFFGILLLGVAIWMLERILPAQIILFLWAALLILSAIYLGVFNKAKSGWKKFWKGVGFLLLSYGVLLMVGATMGNTDPFKPLAIHALSSYPKPAVPGSLFKRVNSLEDLQRELINAKRAGKQVMLDFYADWCIACKIMERDTFSDKNVQNALKDYILLQADVTDNDEKQQALMRHFNVIAPPSILFFDKNGKEITSQRVVGEKGPESFIENLQN